MATAEPTSVANRRKVRRAVLGIILIAGFALAWFWKPIHGRAQAGAAFGARTACSCHYIGGRSLDDCRKDFVSGMGLISLSSDENQKSITARFPLLAKETASFREGPGCVMGKWQD